MPAMAVLAVTVVRVVFLKFPLRWREILTYKNQIIGFCATLLITLVLGFLPLLQLCELERFRKTCVLVRAWSVRCLACFTLSLGCGLVAPTVAVAVMYCMIYRIIRKARKVHRTLSNSTTATSLSKTTESETQNSKSVTEKKTSAKERKLKTERESFPWSIVVILLLNIVSAIPWVILLSFPELIYKKRDSKTFFLLDILYSLLLISTAVSPLAYLLTTKIVRDTMLDAFRSCCRLS
jgi:hypothetical protein